MTLVVQTIADGLVLGGIYALAAVGFSLIFGVLHVINLSHGILVLLGAYLALILSEVLHVDPLLTVPLVMAILFGLDDTAGGWALFSVGSWLGGRAADRLGLVRAAIVGRVLNGLGALAMGLAFGPVARPSTRTRVRPPSRGSKATSMTTSSTELVHATRTPGSHTVTRPSSRTSSA